MEKVSDSVSNAMSFNYDPVARERGELVLTRIAYTSNTTAGLAAAQEIVFEYEDRPDARTSYVGGFAVKMLKRVKAIEARATNGGPMERVRRYEFAYQQDVLNGDSRLVSVQETGADGTSFPATVFDWPTSAATDFLHDSTDAGFTIYDRVTPNFIGDFNGDGRTDYLEWHEPLRNNQYNLLLSTGSGFAAPISTGLNPDSAVPLIPADFNGDGLTDVMVYSSARSRFNLRLANGTGFGPVIQTDVKNYDDAYRSVTPGDFNGDGRTDLLVWNSIRSEFDCYYSNGAGFDSPVHTAVTVSGNNAYPRDLMYPGEYNGDGKTDLFVFNLARGRYDVCYSTGTNFAAPVQTQIINYGNSYGPGIVGDYNGDGLTDFLGYDNFSGLGYYQLFLCTGTGFQPGVQTLITGGNDSLGVKYRQSVDFNGDGKMDFATWQTPYDNNRMNIWISNGAGFDPAVPTSIQRGNDVLQEVGDFNGDGKTDMLVYHSPVRFRMNLFLNQAQELPLIRKVTNGHGGTTSFAYKPLTDPTVYTKGSGLTYPCYDLQASMYVVASVTSRNGIDGDAITGVGAETPGENTVSYRYEGAWMCLDGRGFQGFRAVETTDLTAGVVSRTEYESSSPLLGGRPKHSEQRLLAAPSGGGTLISSSDTSWVITPRSDYPTGKTTYFVQEGSSVSRSYEVNRPSGSALLSTVTRSGPGPGGGSSYDEYANLKQSTTTTVAGSETFTESVTSDYANVTGANWFLGRLTSSTVVKKASGTPDLTRRADFEYDSTTGLLIKEIKEPNDPKLRTEKTYRHDAFGNIEHSELKAWNGIGAPALNEVRTTDTAYTDDKRFILKTTNGLGHSETTLHEPLYGLVELQEGPNKIQTEVEHDGFGRPEVEKRIDGSETRSWYRRCTPGVDGAPARAVYCAITQSSANPASTIYYDVLDREIRKAVVGFDGRLILVDKEYNARGEVVRVSQPYFTGETPLWTVYTYDAVGRVLAETAPGARVTATVYDGFTTTVTNPENQAASRRTDARGLMVEATDTLGQKLSYRHDTYGNLLEVTDLLSRTVTNTLTYDNGGRKLSLAEPNSGTTTYAYNGFGELILQSTSDKRVTTFTYDKLGRLLTRKEPEGTATWFYDKYKSQENGVETKSVGKLLAVAQPGYAEYYRFDGFGRPIETITQIGGSVSNDPLNGRKLAGEKFSVTTAYDHVGRVDTITWPTGFAVRNNYSATGHLESVENADSGLKYWKADTVNARGQVEQETLGNGLVTNRTFVPETGLAATVRTGRNGLNDVQNLSFHFDKIGNLDERRDISRGMTETFIYDDLNRLTSSATTGVTSDFPSVAVSYDGLGNVRSRTDAGTMEYAELATGPGRKLLAGPHAVTSLSSRPGAAPDLRYSYDLRGNRIKSERLVGRAWTTDLNLKFNTANLPVEIVSPAVSKSAAFPDGRKASSSTFSYAPDRARYRQVQKVSGRTTLDRFYIGRLYELEKRGSVKRHVHYIPAGGGTVAIQQSEEGAGALPERTLYLHKDHLGSIETLTDQNGTFVENFSFDAWGRRRTFSLTGSTFVLAYIPADPRPAANVSRGFTGHEMLDAFGLVHMNGRIYDPLVGRFLSADPIVQEMDNLQNLNRYSYVLNNPLSLTDPTGFSFLGKIGKFFSKNWKTIAAVATGILSVGTAVWASALLAGQSFVTLGTAFSALVGAGSFGLTTFGSIVAGAGFGFGSAFSGTLLAGGSIGDAFRAGVIGGAIGGATAGATYGVGEAFGHITGAPNVAQKIVAHGVVGGASSEIQGGKFVHGFLAGSLSAAASQSIANNLKNSFSKVVASAIVGGTASEIGGGKFANGAVTGAFIQLFNEQQGERSLLGVEQKKVFVFSKNDLTAFCGANPCTAIVENPPYSFYTVTYEENRTIRSIFRDELARDISAVEGVYVSVREMLDVISCVPKPLVGPAGVTSLKGVATTAYKGYDRYQSMQNGACPIDEIRRSLENVGRAMK